ncbi:hypothetical protein C5B42_03340 [Candidatus Cerribacteria bacterium 'Amazon FNV 2010 28 9']|uniref:Uncharacterized protein n=1 Tax=Candidatus Cerribacteria bacterium 'Amazon FNV 2010 28 9' TaxID=2081795 RepID=A0A317JQ21_9BACT|nr:MAG: hypothetical protein C5B42_03340 [Candidatus Cerribacteria bacterium 'Amazon FNV 2010 28 9']
MPNEQDSQKPSKTLYDSSVAEIARKHFVAGFSQALGGFFVTILTWIVILFITLRYILPGLQPTLNQFTSIFSSMEKVTGNTKGGQTLTIPNDLIQQFEGQPVK